MRQGIDLYHGIFVADWEKAKDSGLVQFVIHKAAEGATMKDVMVLTRQRICKELGIPFEEYFYVHPEDDANQQLENALDVAGGATGVKRLWLDIEYFTKNGLSMWDNQSLSSRAAKLETIENGLETAGIEPAYYCSKDFLDQYFPGYANGSFFSKRKLWLPDWRPGPGRIPLPWQSRATDPQWDLRQYAAGEVPGIDGEVDFDYASDNFIF